MEPKNPFFLFIFPLFQIFGIIPNETFLKNRSIPALSPKKTPFRALSQNFSPNQFEGSKPKKPASRVERGHKSHKWVGLWLLYGMIPEWDTGIGSEWLVVGGTLYLMSTKRANFKYKYYLSYLGETMQVTIKNVEENKFRELKVESVRHGLTTGEFLGKLVDEHKERCAANADAVLYGEKTLKGILSRDDVASIRAYFRKNFTMRNT